MTNDGLLIGLLFGRRSVHCDTAWLGLAWLDSAFSFGLLGAIEMLGSQSSGEIAQAARLDRRPKPRSPSEQSMIRGSGLYFFFFFERCVVCVSDSSVQPSERVSQPMMLNCCYSNLLRRFMALCFRCCDCRASKLLERMAATNVTQ